jgi:chemotaxis protein methyltransferase CheR
MVEWQEPLRLAARLTEAKFGLSQQVLGDRLASFLAALSPLDQMHLVNHLTHVPETDPKWQQLVEAMLVHETFFYRHMDQLDVVSREVLPLLRQRTGGAIQVWCAGCSTGEEAYTLAFLLRDAACRGRVLATDLSAISVAEAEAGLYRLRPGLNSFRTMPAHGWQHFDPHPSEPNCWSVATGVRQSVGFAVHNLMTPLMLPMKADLISCRNTLIYFSEDSLRQVEAMLVAASRPGTVLLLGPAERLRYTDVFVPMTDSHPQILHWPLPGGR